MCVLMCEFVGICQLVYMFGVIFLGLYIMCMCVFVGIYQLVYFFGDVCFGDVRRQNFNVGSKDRNYLGIEEFFKLVIVNRYLFIFQN